MRRLATIQTQPHLLATAWPLAAVRARASQQARYLTTLFENRGGAEALWVVTGQLLVAGGILLNIFSLGRWLTPTEYGTVGLGLAVSGIFQQTLWGPLSNATSRFYSASVERASTFKLLTESFHFARIVGVFCAAAAAVTLAMSGAAKAKWVTVIPVAIVFSMGYGYTAMLDALQNAARRRGVYAAHQVLGQLVRLVITAGLILFVARTGIVALLAYAIASGVTSLTGTLLLRRIRHGNSLETASQNESWRPILMKYAFPFTTWGLLSGLQAASDRWSLKAFCGGEAVGHYSAAYQLGYYPVLLIGTGISQFLMPIVFQQAGDSTSPARLQMCFRAVTTLTRLTLILGFIAVLLCILTQQAFFARFFGRSYALAAPLWPLSVASGILFVAGQFASGIIYAFGKSQLLIIPFAGTALAGICLNLSGAFLGGIEGVAWAVLLTSLLYFLGPTIVAQKVMASVEREAHPACISAP